MDVYAEQQLRYTAAMDAGQFLSGTLGGVSRGNNKVSRERLDAWQIRYNHYHNRVGIDLPNTKRLIAAQIRPNAHRAIQNLVYETLTHTDLHRTDSVDH